MGNFLLKSVLIGGVATLVLDLWNLALNRLFGFGLPNWAFVGRWVAHLFRGRFRHASMADAEPVAGELTLGWLFHYAVGVLFAVALLLFWPNWAANPGFWPPMIVGWVTILAGWLILSPGMGGGIAHAKRDNPTLARLLNVAGHTVFGLALWAGGLCLLR
jgi:hypothetical protein